MMRPLDYARRYRAAGISVIPVRPDGSKEPALKSFNPYKGPSGRLPTEDELCAWWDAPDPPGIAALCGVISGGLELIDFDVDAERTFAAWKEMVSESFDEDLLARLCLVRTPRGGGSMHVWLRWPGPVPGQTKLAMLSPAEQDAEKERARLAGDKANLVLIETRAEGGYALVPGCPSACHPNHEPYVHVAGPMLWDLELITADERDCLMAFARSLNRDVAGPEVLPKSSGGVGLRPGDDFDASGWDWAQILEAHGWTLAGRAPGGERRWARPGKKKGWSATTGYCKSKGADLFHCFTTGAEGFKVDQSYGKFRAFALLNFAGDLGAAARALAGHGFGEPAFTSKKAETNGRSPDPSAPRQEPQAFGLPIPASLLRLADPALSWVWTGLLRRGEITLMPALWKSGKTTLLAHLLRAMQEGGEFLGQALAPCRVLYVTEESESRWALRRDAVGIADHVEFLVRPFASKPDVPTWEAFLNHVGNLAAPGRYDVVVFDTLANLWPLRDENDASAVQACLMPLHRMIGENAALTLVHHTRKSDGSEATASRGSGALTGFVDTIVEFRRYLPADRSDRRRVLSGYGRHDETPQELVIDLLDEGRYVARGDRESVVSRDLGAVISTILPPREPGYNAEQVAEAWPDSPRPGRDRVLAALKDGATCGRWVQIGEGKRGSPYLFYKPFDEPGAAPE